MHFHHEFVGIIIVDLAIYFGNTLGVNVGWGFVLSDAIHYFIVLWLIMGSPEFHVLYKNVGEMKEEEKLEKKKIKKVIREMGG